MAVLQLAPLASCWCSPPILDNNSVLSTCCNKATSIYQEVSQVLLRGDMAKGGGECSDPEPIKVPEGISQLSVMRFRSSPQMNA